MNKKSRYDVARKILIFWCLFVGIGAVAGATGMFVALDGSALSMQGMLPYFQVLPFADILFQNYLFPGIALLCVNGIPNLIAATFMFRKKYAGCVIGMICGILLMCWITIQFVIFPFNAWSTSFFVFGFLQAVTGYAAIVFYKQECFAVREEDYPNIGKNQKELVVFFSRMGYTKKAALERANKTGAQICEIKASELTEGTKGFWWCGRFGMHRWAMPIQRIEADLDSFDKVTICSPVWVFELCGPVKSFCEESRGKIKKVDYILVHHQKEKYENIFKEMNELLGIKSEHATSICTRKGNEVKRYELY